MGDDRRRYERVRIPLDARWEGLSGRHEARVYDLSLSGCYIESSGQVQVEERVRFELQSPSGRWLSRCKARSCTSNRTLGLPCILRNCRKRR